MRKPSCAHSWPRSKSVSFPALVASNPRCVARVEHEPALALGDEPGVRLLQLCLRDGHGVACTHARVWHVASSETTRRRDRHGGRGTERNSGDRNPPEVFALRAAMELAGLEPATSWVRSVGNRSRPFAEVR